MWAPISEGTLLQKGQTRPPIGDEIPSVILLIFCYAAFVAITVSADTLGLVLSIPLLALIVALHSSLQHEFLHGHPTSSQTVNDLMVSLPIGVYIPYLRFKDTHLAHHHDPSLTDPYDDPESNFLNPEMWKSFSGWRKRIGNFNNTLFGRMIIGPTLSLMHLYSQDVAAALQGNRRIQFSYLHHAVGLTLIGLWLAIASQMPVWAFLVAAYFGMSLLKIRTFLEHRAHEKAPARSVVIEDRGPLALLFLNNNFHAVHHAHPGLVWHRIPQEYARKRDVILRRNGGYWYRSYWSVFRMYLFHRKDPVAHPLMSGHQPSAGSGNAAPGDSAPKRS